jgi:hypothetical protein
LNGEFYCSREDKTDQTNFSRPENAGIIVHIRSTQNADSLSSAIHSKKDADNFMAELNAIGKTRK